MAFGFGALAITASLIGATTAASFPPAPEGVTVVNSDSFPGVSVSYKQICETTDGTKAYSGFVNLPPSPEEGRNYETHTFFWFFEARNDPQDAPLSLWLQGGPGSPSVVAALGENGPCSVNDDSKSTTLNPWSWNDRVNMLYIDQPVQVGFSYDFLTNGTIDEIQSPFIVTPQDFDKTGVPETNSTFLTGTFASQDLSNAPNTTSSAARAAWHFMQTWVQDFPEYKPNDNKFSIWAESYGGHYGPTFSDFFNGQNDLIASGDLGPNAVQLHLDILGLVNACIDIDTQMPFYPEFATNNTYGIQAINETAYESAMSALPMCQNLTATCRTMADELDPEDQGTNAEVNKACSDAYLYCFDKVSGPFQATGLYQFDITTSALGSFPPKWAAGYLNTREVQLALGVPLNFTGNSLPVASVFTGTGDFVRGNNLAILGQLLDQGVKVALVYGDRDYQCNWLGGEQISLAIQSKTTSDFSSAGYDNIETNSSYVGGVVRQHGNLSFSRVFQAGHEVPYYQPETAYQIFNRVMFGNDVATGKVVVGSDYSTSGSVSAFSPSEVPPRRAVQCYLWDIMETCGGPERQILIAGTGIVEDFILIGYHQPNGTDVYFDGGSGSGNGTGNGSGSGSGSGSGPLDSAASARFASGSLFAAGILVVFQVALL